MDLTKLQALGSMPIKLLKSLCYPLKKTILLPFNEVPKQKVKTGLHQAYRGQ